MGRIMKKAKKRNKSKTSSKRRVKSKTSLKRAGAKSKTSKTTKAIRPAKSKKSVLPATFLMGVGAKSNTRKHSNTKRPTKSKKSILPKTSKLKQVAKEAAVAAGLAAVGTALSAMKPQLKGAEEAAGRGAEKKDDTPKN